MVLPHLKNWSLNHLRLKRQSQCNKKLTLISPLWSSGVNQDVFSHLPGKSYRLPSLPGAAHPALGSGVLADGWGVGGKGRVSAMCRDLNPNSPAAVWPPVAPAPIEHKRLQAGSCQLSKPDQLPSGIPHLEKPSLGLVQKHLCILMSLIIFKATQRVLFSKCKD